MIQLNHREAETTKADYGHAILIAGSYGKMGCAILAAEAALRAGCGLLTVHVPQQCVDLIQMAVPEAMTSIDRHSERFTTLPDHLERYNAIAVGPGIGTHKKTYKALRLLFEELQDTPTQLILDADALNIIAQHDRLKRLLPKNTIITPHAREYERLYGTADPIAVATQNDLVIVKKSHQTHIYTPDSKTHVNHTGNPGMATAGSGDVLTGILLGISAQGALPVETAVTGVFLHGKSGDIAVQKQSQASLIARDIIENFKYASLAESID